MPHNQFPDGDQNPFAASVHQSQQKPVLPVQDMKSRILAPGVALLVVGILGFLAMAGTFSMVLISFAFNPAILEPQGIELSEEEKQIQSTMLFITIGYYGVSALAQIPVILGGIGMIRCKWKSMVYFGSIISVIPCCSSFFVIGIPFGIWALVVMSDSNVRASFTD